MVTARRQRFIHGQAAVMFVALFILALLDALTLPLYFVISLVGFLVMLELTAPFHVQPAWRSRLKWIVLLGLVVFIAIIVRRILQLIPPGLI